MTLEQKVDICLRYIAAQDPQCIENTRDYDEFWTTIDLAKRALDEPTDNMADRATDFDDILTELLKELGVAPQNLGYRYIRYGVALVLDDKSYADNITKKLYPAIARAHNTTQPRAERAIRHAIDRAFLEGDPDAQYKIFGNTIAAKGRPTNSGFITACAMEVQKRMRAAA